MFDRRKPCITCPFRIGEKGLRYLGEERAQEIVDSLLGDDTFTCHDDIDLDDENKQHCAGATIILEKINRPNQMMRICERIKMYDRHTLTGHEEVVEASLMGWLARGLPVLLSGDHKTAGRHVARILFIAARRRYLEARALAAGIAQDENETVERSHSRKDDWMTSRERAKERIRKLLAVTKDNAATDGEIENAMCAARNEIHAHNIDESELSEEQQKQAEMGAAEFPLRSTATSMWEWDLMNFVCKFVGGIDSYRQGNPVRVLRGGKAVQVRLAVFYGEAEMCEMAREMFAELHDTVITMAKLQFSSTTRGDGRDYAEGFVSGLQTKLRNLDERALNADSKSRALVVQSRDLMLAKKQEANKWLRNVKGIKPSQARRYGPISLGSISAFGQGMQDGQAQSLSRLRKAKLTYSN